MTFNAASLHEFLGAHISGVSGWVVAVSGGADSSALLAALCQGRGVCALPLRAVHVNHGLQSAAALFHECCVKLAQHFKIPLTELSVIVAAGPGVSLEAAAREARYAALAADLRPGECLLTAHHQQDQAESLLLQALRGAGPKGLSGMPAIRPLGQGWHLRPLLEVAQCDLRDFYAALNLTSAHDPMNDDLRFDRVYLRKLWPMIESRWPGASSALARAAQHAAQAQVFLEDAARRDLACVRDGDRIMVSGLRGLPDAARLNVLRYWISSTGALLPSTSRLKEALRQILNAQSDHLPVVFWGEHALRRYRDRVFLTPKKLPVFDQILRWSTRSDAELDLGNGLGKLCWIPQQGGLDLDRLPKNCLVHGRMGGERIKLGLHSSTQTLQHLYQRHGILPWMRSALPLIYIEESLVAVGDLWVDARWCVSKDALGVGVLWLQAPVCA